MLLSNIQIVDVRDVMADRESVSHLPLVEEHIQIPGHLFESVRNRMHTSLSFGFLHAARLNWHTLRVLASGASEPEDCIK